MPIPQIHIDFFGNLKPRPRRNPAGVVALILSDDTQTGDTFTYTQGADLAGWSPENQGYIELAFMGAPRKVIVERVDTTATDYTSALDRLRNKRFDYMAIPGIEAAETDAVATWVRERRADDRKKFKAVLPDTAADHESIINFTATGIT